MANNNFYPNKVAFAVITSYPKWYRGKLRSIKHTEKIRGDLALEFAHKVLEAGYYLVISDHNSPKTFLKELPSTQSLILIRRKKEGSSGHGKRVAIEKAVRIPGAEVIILCEPEKVSVVTSCMHQLVESVLQGKADIVIPRRSENLFKSTYPQYMYESETEGNRIYNEALRSNNILSRTMPNFDWFFGPRAIKNDKKVIALLKRKYVFTGVSFLENLYSPDQYSNVQFFPIVAALKKKLRVLDVEVPFRYPEIQKENEDIGARDIFILKRNLQRVTLLIDLMHFISYLERKKSSGLKSV